MKKLNAIYIPGLGDSKSRAQDKAIKLLGFFRIKCTYFPIGWAEKGDFIDRLGELDKKITELSRGGKKVSLIAASAGASAALNAFALNKDKISSVTLICGKVQNLDAINQSYYNANPKFEQSVNLLKKSMPKLDAENRAKILSIRPRRDSVVPPEDTVIVGARNMKSFTYGHSSTIAHYLTVGIPRVAWWIRKNS